MKPKLLSLILLAGLIKFGNQPLAAQELSEKNFKLYTKQDGLSRNTITGIAQDSIGYIWTATPSGLNRFDGTNFVQFHNNDDNLSLPSDYIKGLEWLDKWRLAAYGDGLHIVNTCTGESHNLFIPSTNKQFQYKFNWIMSVRSDTAGEVFVLTRSGFYHFDKDYHLVFRFDYYTAKETKTTPFVFGRYLVTLNDTSLAIISCAGIYYYNSKRRQFKKMDATDCPLFAGMLDYPKSDYQFFQQKPGCIFVMHSDKDSLVFLNTIKNIRTSCKLPFKKASDEFDYHSEISTINNFECFITSRISGFYKIDIAPGSYQIRFNAEKLFPNYSCTQLLKDKDHNVWIATTDGLLHHDEDRKLVQQIRVPDSLHALFPNLIVGDQCMIGDKLYVATHGIAGILVFQDNRFIHRIDLKKYYKQPGNIYSLMVADSNTLLVGTNGPLFRLNLKTNQITEVLLEQSDREHAWIADICKDKKNNIWIASEKIYNYHSSTHTATIIRAKQDPNDKVEWVQRMAEDREGNIWFAGNGLVRYNIRTHEFDKLVDSFPFIKIPDKQVISVVADAQNNLWINCNNNGLICYNIDKASYRLFTRDNGLPENNIASMIIVGNKLWIASFSGIACLDLKTYRIISFGKEDGFPDQPIPIASRFFYDSTANRIYIGFTNCIAAFDPVIADRKSLAPKLFIERLVTADKNEFIFKGTDFTSSWKNNDVMISIGSINFFTGNSQGFAYRQLKNDSSAWQQLGTQNQFTISNMTPGRHSVQLKLFSLYNRWPEQVKQFDIVITPPFWKEDWFNLLVSAGVVILLFSLYKWRTEQIRKKERAKTHLQQLKAEEYKNQFELEQISNYFSSSLEGKKTVDEVLWDVSKNLIGRMNFADCMIYLWNEDKTRMVQKASYGPKGDLHAITEKLFDVEPGQGVVGYVILTKEPIIIPDTRFDSRYRMDDVMRLSEICVPIIHNSELIGIIDSEHPNANHFQDRDVKVLTTIATLISNKIKQIESEHSLEVKQQEIGFINQQLAEAQLLALQTQMNPHFIFNSLNSIKGMILENEQQAASRYMSKFGNMLRITLNQSKEVFTTLHENMEHLENYLAMEKLRFDGTFTYRIIADEEIDMENTLVPTMMIQPLAENAIWHGLIPKKGRKKLMIHFSLVENRISCLVEDNGIGLKQSEAMKMVHRPLHRSVGLSNLRHRIRIMNEKYDTGCTLEITDLNDLNKDKTGSCAILS
ncbi:MAG: histidine kinase, partial [Flavisolibacter sp.]